MLAAMNPCPCGFFGDPTRGCQCTPPMIQRYVTKISGPLLDRIDIHIEVPSVKYTELRAPTSSENSNSVRQRVIAARQRQLERFRSEKKTYSKAQMAPKLIRKHCTINAESEKLLENAVAGSASPPAPTIASLKSPAPSPTSKPPPKSSASISAKPSSTAPWTGPTGSSLHSLHPFSGRTSPNPPLTCL